MKEEFSPPNANRVPIEKVWGTGDKEERKVCIALLFYFLEIINIVTFTN